MRKVSNDLERLLREQFGDAAAEKHISDEHVAVYNKYKAGATFLPQEVEALRELSKAYPFINIDFTLIKPESGNDLHDEDEGESSKEINSFSHVSDIPGFNNARGISSPSSNDISVNTASIRFSNAPTTRLADMPYSPVVSPSLPPANLFYPHPQPQFQPRTPHNTILSDDWYTRYTEQTTGRDTEIPMNNEPKEQAANTTTTVNTGANKRKAGNDEGSVSNKKARTS
ncbi:uncharacterized protein FTOL_10078 [Fusarium torulosum]|uniref:Uncharacterized protein n=1 Tax=Fusarium torulosum TaxID=33205 RepID=A0AAE8MFN0_9HYPO|nr:uncharacterized protein FTOL_10078 [Fusarium torulosum]